MFCHDHRNLYSYLLILQSHVLMSAYVLVWAHRPLQQMKNYKRPVHSVCKVETLRVYLDLQSPTS
jgi:hypothetical protein